MAELAVSMPLRRVKKEKRPLCLSTGKCNFKSYFHLFPNKCFYLKALKKIKKTSLALYKEKEIRISP